MVNENLMLFWYETNKHIDFITVLQCRNQAESQVERPCLKPVPEAKWDICEI